jgi:hypothetical protein
LTAAQKPAMSTRIVRMLVVCCISTKTLVQLMMNRHPTGYS